MTKIFIVKARKEEVERGFSVPRHNELVCVEELSATEWMARNTRTEEIVMVTRMEKGDFVEFTIS